MPPKKKSQDIVLDGGVILKRESCVKFEQTNPKKRGSGAADRYDKYKLAKTIGEAMDLGASQGDLKNDSTKGYLHLASDAEKKAEVESVEAADLVQGKPSVAVPALANVEMQSAEVAALDQGKSNVDAPAVAAIEIPRAGEVGSAPGVAEDKLQVEDNGSKPMGKESARPAEESKVTSSQPLAPSVASVPTPQPGPTKAYEVDLSFTKFDGKPMKFMKRTMGEARKLLSERGIAEHEKEGLYFSLKDRDNLSRWAVTVKDLNPDGQLLKDLKKLGLEQSIDLEFILPDGFPLEPPFVRVVYPQLAGGFVFSHGAICFEPLTEKGWAPSMTLPALSMSIKGILDHGGVRATGAGNKETRTIPQYTEAGARKDHSMISKAHRDGDARTYGGKNSS